MCIYTYRYENILYMCAFVCVRVCCILCGLVLVVCGCLWRECVCASACGYTYVHTYTHTHTYTRTHIHTHTRTYTHTHTHVHVHAHAHAQTLTHAQRTRSRTHTHTCTLARTREHSHAHICAHAHAHAHAHTHAHAHIHTHYTYSLFHTHTNTSARAHTHRHALASVNFLPSTCLYVSVSVCVRLLLACVRVYMRACVLKRESGVLCLFASMHKCVCARTCVCVYVFYCTRTHECVVCGRTQKRTIFQELIAQLWEACVQYNNTHLAAARVALPHARAAVTPRGTSRDSSL